MAVLPDMIGFVVKDMGAALRYYRLLGLAIPEGLDDEPYVDVTTPNGYRISWNSAEMVSQFDPEAAEPAGRGPEVAFKCDSPAEVDAVYARMVAAGYTGRREPWDAFWGQRYAILVDPDGHQTSLFAPLPAS